MWNIDKKDEFSTKQTFVEEDQEEDIINNSREASITSKRSPLNATDLRNSDSQRLTGKKRTSSFLEMDYEHTSKRNTSYMKQAVFQVENDGLMSATFDNPFKKEVGSEASRGHDGLNLHIQSEIISHDQHKFAQIMVMDEISPEDVMESLSVEMNRHMVFKAGQGAGLSGSFFFFSHDNKFLIKTVNELEMKILLGMLDDMISHFNKTNN